MNEVAVPKKNISSLLANPKVQDRIANALGDGIDQHQFMAQLQISLSTDKLAQCDPNSLFAAAHFCACLGLLPSLKQIAIIPRQVKDKGQVIRIDADPMPQWQGYKAIMMRHPDVLDITANLVHKSDDFVCDPTQYPPVQHRYDPFSESRIFKDFGDLKGGYLIVHWRDQSRPSKYHFVSCDTIRKARGCALTGDIWEAWFEEQCLKTVYRNAFARQVIPIDFAVNRALERLVEAEDKLHGNEPLRVSQQQAPRLTHQAGVNRSAAIASRMQSTPVEPEPAIEPSGDDTTVPFPPDDDAAKQAEYEAEMLAAKERGDLF